MSKANELLVCNCEDGGEHIMKKGLNDETIVECTECKRMLKFPADDITVYKGPITKDYTKKEGIGPNK